MPSVDNNSPQQQAQNTELEKNKRKLYTTVEWDFQIGGYLFIVGACLPAIVLLLHAFGTYKLGITSIIICWFFIGMVAFLFMGVLVSSKDNKAKLIDLESQNDKKLLIHPNSPPYLADISQLVMEGLGFLRSQYLDVQFRRFQLQFLTLFIPGLVAIVITVSSVYLWKTTHIDNMLISLFLATGIIMAILAVFLQRSYLAENKKLNLLLLRIADLTEVLTALKVIEAIPNETSRLEKAQNLYESLQKRWILSKFI